MISRTVPAGAAVVAATAMAVLAPAVNAAAAAAPAPGRTVRASPAPALAPPNPDAAGWDARNVYFSGNPRVLFTSPWYSGVGRHMLPFGCTSAPYYARSAACAYRSGFHHGVDMAVRTGTVIKAGYSGRILDGSTMGPAYGANRFRLRATVNGVTKDFLIGHTAKNYVKVGQWVTAGQAIAVAGASGAPDGTHLHLEVRPVNGGLASAHNPYPYGRFAAVGSL